MNSDDALAMPGEEPASTDPCVTAWSSFNAGVRFGFGVGFCACSLHVRSDLEPSNGPISFSINDQLQSDLHRLRVVPLVGRMLHELLRIISKTRR